MFRPLHSALFVAQRCLKTERGWRLGEGNFEGTRWDPPLCEWGRAKTTEYNNVAFLSADHNNSQRMMMMHE